LQRAREVAARIEHDLHRDALDDLGEVAGGVVRRQQRELLATRGRDAVDVAVEHHAGIGVDGNRDRLARMNIGELGLLVVGDNVRRRERHHRHQLGPRLHILADAQRAVADNAVDRRRDDRVREIELGLVPQRLIAGNRRLRLGELGFQHVELLGCVGERSIVARDGGAAPREA
jgi:hypothetical protein